MPIQKTNLVGDPKDRIRNMILNSEELTNKDQYFDMTQLKLYLRANNQDHGKISIKNIKAVINELERDGLLTIQFINGQLYYKL